MHTYFAVSSKKVFNGSFIQCVKWSNNLLLSQQAKIIKIFKARPNEKNCKIVFEVSRDKGLVPTPHGRTVPASLLKKKNV